MSPDDAAEGYADWKGWTTETFGHLSRGDTDYYSREVRDVVRRNSVGRVLEIGFGNGAFLAFCRRQGWDVTGVELLPELVDAANAAGFSAYPSDRLADVPNGSFDAVFAFDVFEHIAPEASIDFLRALRAKLRPGGVLMLRYPNVDSWIGNPFQYGDVTHVNAIGALKMGYYADTVGFDVIALRATKRRGFAVSPIHGIHALTAGVLAKIVAGVAKAVYFPDIRVVLSSSSVITILTPRE
ncbi:class I SAM-dependent methyltransferase [Agromyces sp. CCNWLW203]|uniref:class I SAM-dependent methyltransferase n=1 Tax=Agromyces sp. CCNWLW203 TaxID=3112842 RepID=UPI002F9660DC